MEVFCLVKIPFCFTMTEESHTRLLLIQLMATTGNLKEICISLTGNVTLDPGNNNDFHTPSIQEQSHSGSK